MVSHTPKATMNARCPYCHAAPDRPCRRMRYRCRRGEERSPPNRVPAQRMHKARARRMANATKEARLA